MPTNLMLLPRKQARQNQTGWLPQLARRYSSAASFLICYLHFCMQQCMHLKLSSMQARQGEPKDRLAAAKKGNPFAPKSASKTPAKRTTRTNVGGLFARAPSASDMHA